MDFGVHGYLAASLGAINFNACSHQLDDDYSSTRAVNLPDRGLRPRPVPAFRDFPGLSEPMLLHFNTFVYSK